MKKFIIQPEFTNYCNLRCRFCPHSAYKQASESGNRFDRKKGYMSKELFRLVLENAQKNAKSVIIGFFGEPLLHPAFTEYVKLFPADRYYTLEINTNWSLVTKKHMETLKLFDCVRISLDATDAELYEKLCPGTPMLDLSGIPCQYQDRYYVLTEKIDYWLNLSDHATTKIVYVVSSLNEHDRERFVKTWRPKLKLSTDHLITKSVISYGGVMKDNHMKKNRCEVESQRWFTVAWNGDCSPCNLDVNIALMTGNLLEMKDMKKIIKSREWGQIMKKVKQKSSICANCFDANNWIENEIYYRI